MVTLVLCVHPFVIIVASLAAIHFMWAEQWSGEAAPRFCSDFATNALQNKSQSLTADPR